MQGLVMFPWEKQTSPSRSSALPGLINFLAEPYGQSWGMIFPQELSIPLQSVVPPLPHQPLPVGLGGCWDAGDTVTGDWGGISGVK